MTRSVTGTSGASLAATPAAGEAQMTQVVANMPPHANARQRAAQRPLGRLQWDCSSTKERWGKMDPCRADKRNEDHMSCQTCQGWGCTSGRATCADCDGSGVERRLSEAKNIALLIATERERAARLVETQLTGSAASLVARQIRGRS